MQNSVLVIVNPVSGNGKGKTVLGQVENRLQRESLTYRTVFTREDIAETALTTEELASYRCIWIIGGDGTLHSLLNYFGILPVPVALISGGTGNDFAEGLLGTKDPMKQIGIAIGGTIKKVDLGICNGVYFATGVGIGFDGLIARKVNFFRRLTGSAAAYYFAVLTNLFFYREKKLTIESEGKSREIDCFMLTIGNTPAFGGGFRVTPEADPSDGIFDMNIITRVSIPERIAHLTKVQKGRHLHLPFVIYNKGTAFNIISDSSLPCHMDGELYEWNNFNVSVLPSSLQVMMP